MKLNELKTGDRFTFANQTHDGQGVQIVAKQCRQADVLGGFYYFRDASIVSMKEIKSGKLGRLGCGLGWARPVAGDSLVIKTN